MIDTSEKKRLLSELVRDSSKDFDSEWKRTLRLQQDAIRDYGFEGMQLILKVEDGLDAVALQNTPESCSWRHLAGNDVQSIIREVFSPMHNKLPTLVDMLCERCRFIFALNQHGSWQLGYFLNTTTNDGLSYYRLYIGGQPNLSPIVPPRLQQIDWKIPESLAELAAIHDGFGGFGENLVLPIKELTALDEYMAPDEIGSTPWINYQPTDLLMFFTDSAGNGQCFHRRSRLDPEPMTVDWDHETRELSAEETFFSFINCRLSEIDEE
jgi:hypothetical protein